MGKWRNHSIWESSSFVHHKIGTRVTFYPISLFRSHDDHHHLTLTFSGLEADDDLHDDGTKLRSDDQHQNHDFSFLRFLPPLLSFFTHFTTHHVWMMVIKNHVDDRHFSLSSSFRSERETRLETEKETRVHLLSFVSIWLPLNKKGWGRW